MRFFLSFVLFFAFSLDSWASCVSISNTVVLENQTVGIASACSHTGGCTSEGCNYKESCEKAVEVASCPNTLSQNGVVYTNIVPSTSMNLWVDGVGQIYRCPSTNTGCFTTNGLGNYYYSCVARVRCTTQCEADSVAGCPDGQTWDSQNCRCKPATSYHCQNSGGSESGGIGGSPSVALLFTCNSGVCTQTGKLNGSCQDWGFCPDGVSDCDVSCSGGDCPPCGRSGGSFTSSRSCYYACFDGKNLSCRPSSTQYVAGSIYVGDCPSSPPSDCRPRSSSSSASSSASSSPSLASSSSGYLPPIPSDTVEFPGNDGKDYEIDYTSILQAIHDTLHRANYQRDFLLELQNSANLDLDNISNYSVHNYNELSKISSGTSSLDSTLSGLASGGFNLVQSTQDDISNSRRLLDEINQYLHSDSLLSPRPSDTTYNPLLRDIKGAIDSVTFNPLVDTSIFARDSVFAKWWANYYSDSASSRGLVGKALGSIVDNLTDSRDSARASDCDGYLGCMSVYKNIEYCSNAWGVSLSDCAEGGTPFDGIWNTEVSILETVWKFFFGDSTADYTPSSIDSAVSFSPALSAAYAGLSSASGVLDTLDVSGLLENVQNLLDSAQKARNDSVKIQPDSLWLDSLDASQYVSNILFPGGTSTDCFICHADLGTFGGLSDTSLSIHIDFSNFGGFDWCALVRAVVKIATLVVCISLTLGSWMAAFGYNPKNDG